MNQLAFTAATGGGGNHRFDAGKVRLRPYQEDALAAVEAAEWGGNRKQVLVLPTGAGKTIIFAALIARRQARALVLAHRDELISQAVDKLHAVMPAAQVGVVKAAKDDHWAPIVVASVQTLANAKRRAALARQRWDLVICDEAHHSAAATYRTLYDELDCGVADGPLLIGVTATPDRGDRIRLDDIFDGISYEIGLLDLITQGYLCNVRAVRVAVEGLDLDGVKRSGGDFQTADLERALEDADQPAMTALAVQEHAASRRSLVFTATVALAQETAAELLALGIPTEWVSGEMPMIDRRAVLRRFETGQTQCVVNCMVLTEGFDNPAVDCVVVARPTSSRALYQQMVGRGLRLAPGKTDCLIVDVVGVSQRHTLQTAAALTGVDFAAKGAGDGPLLTEAIQAAGGMGRDPITGRLVSIPVDLFGRSRFAWTKAGTAGGWAIPFDGETSLAIAPGGHGWDILKIGTKDSRVEIVEEAIDGAIVQGLAEEIVRRDGDVRLTDRSKAWRADPTPTEKQLNYARTLRIDLEALAADNGGVLTKGLVSDAINAAQLTKSLDRWTRARMRGKAA